MANTCIISPMLQIIEPILSATLPDTPESISSKIMVGILVYSAIRALRQSIIRDISPPEAHFASSTGFRPEALNLNTTPSLPLWLWGAGWISALNTAFSNSRKWIDSSILAEKPSQAWTRESCKASAICRYFFCLAARAALSTSILSTIEAESNNALANELRMAISSSTVLQLCLFIRP